MTETNSVSVNFTSLHLLSNDENLRMTETSKDYPLKQKTVFLSNDENLRMTETQGAEIFNLRVHPIRQQQSLDDWNIFWS